MKVDIAEPTVALGVYTHQILRALHLNAVLANVVGSEADVRTVLAKVAYGKVDAGFVYETDAKTMPGLVTIVRIPARAQPRVAYAVAVVTASRHRATAQAFVAKLLAPVAQAKLRAAGFLAPS